MEKLTLSKACEGLLLYKTAGGKSPHTIRNYRNSFRKLKLFFPRSIGFKNWRHAISFRGD